MENIMQNFDKIKNNLAYLMPITLIAIVGLSAFLFMKGRVSEEEKEMKKRIVTAVENFYENREIKSVRVLSVNEIDNFGEVNEDLNIGHIQEIVDAYDMIESVYNEVPSSLIDEFYKKEYKRLMVDDVFVPKTKGDSLIANSIDTYLAFIQTFGHEDIREAYYLNAMQQRTVMHKLLEMWKGMKGYEVAAKIKFKDSGWEAGKFLLNENFTITQEIK